MNPIGLIRDAAERGRLIVVAGTGVSMALTGGREPRLSWRGLIEDGFRYGVDKGKISSGQAASWRNQLNSDDLDDLLAAAEFMGRKLGAPSGDLYGRWLASALSHAKPTELAIADAIRRIANDGVPIATLNYDTLLEEVTSLPSINMSNTTGAASWLRREKKGIFHLHGSWDDPGTCVLGIRDYEQAVRDDVRAFLQKMMSSMTRLLFIGCGDTFSDPNFSALIGWLRTNMNTATPEHFALVASPDLPRRNADPAWHGFVEPISYGDDHGSLAKFLLNLLPPAIRTRDPTGSGNGAKAHRATAAIDDYRSFLVADCGQMTIEGVRADLDTAQRRFDLERLFVPLKVVQVPPEYPAGDPKREEKLEEWFKHNSKPLSFGEAFQQHPRIALLALPGGGKTLLLKRLAVAYADTARRDQSSDCLPELDVVPLLIRCREWKDYIRLPIFSLLEELPKITGRPGLRGLQDGLLAVFEEGRVLLLVDGLDEIHDDGDRTAFVGNLETLLSEYPNIRLVVTSREAGFSLVAPSIARFCTRWRISPLEEDSIRLLCTYWHLLMVGETPESAEESKEVADKLLASESLQRLAENPLLLTMLLVVKHGAGRLPPDRVSLYDRAVEVLLDTWNIKGHEPLNLKEAVPQLACVAYELLKRGRQTATERELLSLLEEAREKVPQIRRYAKDTPSEFLKRVELRSSLLLEGGHQFEGTKAVPFYQFRHLTFQEYLAAVAAAEGNYLSYKTSDTVLTPVTSFLTLEEWKEVIPMAAVLARKQSEPLVAALAHEAETLRVQLERSEQFEGRKEWLEAARLPAPVSRLVQCLVEEAEVSQDTLYSALKTIAMFTRGAQVNEDWRALIRGPYGEELLHQTWLTYASREWPPESWLRNTFAAFCAFRVPDQFWRSPEGRRQIAELLRSPGDETVARGLATITGSIWGGRRKALGYPDFVEVDLIERHFDNSNIAVVHMAVWAWALIRAHWPKESGLARPLPTAETLASLCELFTQADPDVSITCGFAFSTIQDVSRHDWTPRLNEEAKDRLRTILQENVTDTDPEGEYLRAGAFFIAYYATDVVSDAELLHHLDTLESRARFLRSTGFFEMFESELQGGSGPISGRGKRPRRKRR